MKLLAPLFGILFVAAAFSADVPAQKTDETADLQKAVQEAGASPIDFVRVLEKHLQKYPDSKRRAEIERALLKAARELNDDRRVAQYGERLLETDPQDVSLLEMTGKALNSFGDPKAAERSLAYGARLAKEVEEKQKGPSTEESERDRIRSEWENKKTMSSALLIQANAAGILGRLPEAVKFAQQSFETYPVSESARALGLWLAKSGNTADAVTAYANAFALADTRKGREQDRQKMGELYRKAHTDETGLGDLILAAYDRTNRLMEQRQNELAKLETKPTDATLTKLSGEKLAMRSLQGKIIVLDFWATWCQPCRAQHPLYEKVKEKFKNDSRVIFLAVTDEDRSTVESFLTRNQWSKEVYLEEGLSDAFNITSIPTTILLNKNGELYSKMVGFNPEYFVDLLTSRINEALTASEKLSSALVHP